LIAIYTKSIVLLWSGIFSSVLRNKPNVFVLLKMKQKSIIPIHHVIFVVLLESEERD